MGELFGEACRLLERSKGKFLFSDNLSSADGFMISIVFRIGDCDKALLQSLFKQFPRLGQWWTDFSKTQEAEVILPYGMSWAKKMALKNGVIFKIVGLKTGILKPPPLPARVENMIKEEFARQRTAYYA